LALWMELLDILWTSGSSEYASYLEMLKTRLSILKKKYKLE